MSDRGSALLETLAIGFVTVLFFGQALVTVGRVAAAGEMAEEAARHAAVAAAAGGPTADAAQMAAALAPGATVSVADAEDSITVEVVVQVSAIGPASGPVTLTVRGVATAPLSPYRSG